MLLPVLLQNHHHFHTITSSTTKEAAMSKRLVMNFQYAIFAFDLHYQKSVRVIGSVRKGNVLSTSHTGMSEPSNSWVHYWY